LPTARFEISRVAAIKLLLPSYHAKVSGSSPSTTSPAILPLLPPQAVGVISNHDLQTLTGASPVGVVHDIDKVESVEALVPPREFGFCPGCPHRASYWSIKQVLAVDGRDGLVSGDIGCYTLGVLPTGFQRVNSVHCMGSGLGVSAGLGQLGRFGFDQPVVSVVGDSTFFHSALPGLVNARWNRADYVLIVLDNSATAMTGFQPHPGTGETASGAPGSVVDVEDMCRALGIPCRACN